MVIGNMDSTKEAITEYPSSISHTIKTGCGTDAKPATNNGDASIENHDKPGATLKITNMQPGTGADLEETGGTQCTVKVEGTNKLTIEYEQGGKNKCITIEITSGSITKAAGDTTATLGHILTEGFDTNTVRPAVVSPTLMVIVGIVFLIATIFPPVIIAVLRLKAKAWSPQHNLGGSWGLWKTYKYDHDWQSDTPEITVYAYLWHFFDLLMDIKISLAVVFIYSLQYTRNTKF